MNTKAYQKGGANRPVRWTGKSDKYQTVKSNFLDLGAALVEDEKFGESGRRAAAARKHAWTLEKGRHFMAASWVITYGNKAIDEEAIDCHALVNNNNFRAQDVSLVRKATYGYFERPDRTADSLALRRAPVLAQEEEVDDLGYFEMGRYRDTGVLPPRLRLRRTFPPLATGSLAQVLCVDFNYSYASGIDSTSEYLLTALGRNKANIHPMLYDVGGGHGRDAYAFYSLGVAFMALSLFEHVPFGRIKLRHLTAYLDYEWVQWCDRTLKRVELPESATTADKCRRLLEELAADESKAYANDYVFDDEGFHGIMTATELEQQFERWRPRVGDVQATRRTHIAIIVQAPKEVPDEAPPCTPTRATSASVNAPHGPRSPAHEAVHEISPAHAAAVNLPNTDALPNPGPPVPLDLTEIERELAERVLNQAGDTARLVREARELEGSTSAPVGPFRVPPKDGPPGHHYVVAWRYGSHSVVRTRKARESLTPYEGGAELRRAYLAKLRMQFADERLPAPPPADPSDPDVPYMAQRRERQVVHMVQDDSDHEADSGSDAQEEGE